MYQLVEFISKKPVIANNLVFSGDHSPWEILIDMAKAKAELNLTEFKSIPPALAKYLPLMPIKPTSEFVSLGEVATPLLKSKVLGKQLNLDLYFKLEGKNPTGSFKDRGSAVDISIAKEFSAPAIILASTGNMAASCACYAAVAKIPCFVLVPEDVSMAKLAQLIAFGGLIVKIKGNYNDAAKLAEIIAKEMGFYLAGDYAFRVEGQKTAAFELIDQLSFQTPDAVVVPIGCGTNIAAYAKGFSEYQQLGIIDKIPQLIGVQAQGSNAVVQSYLQHQTEIYPLKTVNTIASAIAVPNPIDGIKALNAIYTSQGTAIAVDDQEILQAQHLLASQEGLFVEPASATTIAALKKLTGSEKLRNKKVICILTGDGLKDTEIILKTAVSPNTIYPDKQEFLAIYKSYTFRK